MAKRVLAIGVGGTGKAALTILKERLVETYDVVPDNVVLLSIDTDDLRDVDQFGGVSLEPQIDERQRDPEFIHVVTPAGMSMDTVIADINSGRTRAYMDWLEAVKLDKTLNQTERNIRGGAQQRRQVGRTALFLGWQAVYGAITSAISNVYGEPEEQLPVDNVDIEISKRVVFIVGSLSGGTGSGFFIDVANLVRHAVNSNPNWESIDVSGVIVLPDAFSSYTTVMDDPTNLKPNSFSALREIDRFSRAHSNVLPYLIRYSDNQTSLTWETNQPLDQLYLVDTASRSATQDLDLSGDPMAGVFPVVADFMMAHVDNSLGDNLATLRSNAGLHYSKQEGWMYSSFNSMTYIFPVRDVIQSFSLRFLRETLSYLYLMPSENSHRADIAQAAKNEVDRDFSAGSIGKNVNPGLIQNAIACTRVDKPETPDTSWEGLFNLIAISDEGFANDLEDLHGWLNSLEDDLVPSKDGDYKREDFSEGYDRLMAIHSNFLDKVLGPQYDPENEDARTDNGQWKIILRPYRDAQKNRFANVLDHKLLEVLNRRDPNNNLLAPSSLPMASALLDSMKARLVEFRAKLRNEYSREEVEDTLRIVKTDLRDAIAQMYETRDAQPFLMPRQSAAYKAQQAYIDLVKEKMRLELHQLIYSRVLDILNALGADDRDEKGELSILDKALLEVEDWTATFADVDQILKRKSRQHENNRQQKNRVKVRRYLTNPEFEKELYQRPEHFQRAVATVWAQVQGNKGITWDRKSDEIALAFEMLSTWTKERSVGAEEIASEWIKGANNIFSVVRQSTVVADRIASEFSNSARFVNKVKEVSEPLLRYNASQNGKPLFAERYVSVNYNNGDDDTQKFLTTAEGTLRNEGQNFDAHAESLVAASVIHVARGAKLTAIDQFTSCAPEYRRKLHIGQESLHLFKEEQYATELEQRIETLGEYDNIQRIFDPELVVCLGNEVAVKAFALASAYGLISEDRYFDADTGEETTEVFLTYKNRNGDSQRLPISDSRLLAEADPLYNQFNADGQKSRRLLNALQNFVLKVVAKPGVDAGMVPTLVESLSRQGVNLGGLQRPFTLNIRDVNLSIRQKLEEDHLTNDPNGRISRYLQPYIDNQISLLKATESQAVKDLGTVLQLVIRDEIKSLRS